MRHIASFVAAVMLAAGAHGQATQPMDSGDPLLGKVFRSRIDGIAFNPPAGGAKIRELNTGEIVRFVYPDSRWDVRVKPIPLHTPMPLSAPPDQGLLELTATQLTGTNPTLKILRRDVISVHGQNVGLIEAAYNAGTDHVFAQQALFNDVNKKGIDRHYLSVQMTSQDAPDEDKTARELFSHMLESVQVLDREELGKEQDRRLFKTRGLWVLLDRKAITAALQPLHFMRVVRDGRDAGFIQVNEREATHNGNDGIEIILHSQVQADQHPELSSDSTASADPAPADPAAIVIDKQIGPSRMPATRPAGPQTLYTQSTFFVTFDRDHEDWTTITQADNHITDQLTETAYCDKTVRRRFNAAQARMQHPTTRQTRNSERSGKPKTDDREPPIIEIPRSILDVTYSHGHHQDTPLDFEVPPFYLPQALGQLLPRLLPTDPGQYLFASYVSTQRQVMSRYVDVEAARMVNLDGQPVRAVPITDRIGADGTTTTHYVTRDGEWLGSVSEDQRLQVFPTDEQTLKGLWPGFAVSTEPTGDVDAPGN